MESIGHIGSMQIDEEVIFLDFMEELAPFIDRFNKAKVRGIKLISCSPFRSDNSPSFAVNLDNGLWVDSGALDDQYKKGNFISLLAKLSQDDYAEVKEYLLRTYSTTKRDVNALALSMNLKPVEKPAVDLHLDYSYSEYLASRGISKETQELYGTSENDGAIAIAWKNVKGTIINIKYRCTTSKKFWYNSTGESIRHSLFGLDLAKNQSTVWLVESEIDAMYLHTAGYWAVAIGRACVTDNQIKLLINSRIENIVIGVDNDKVGKQLKAFLIDYLKPHFKVYTVDFPDKTKDINDCTIKELHTMYNGRTTTQALNLSLAL